jgi:GDP-L-fucose synthase
MTSPLEPTNEGYAIAKTMGVKLCEKYRMQYEKNFISAMPTNLYGPEDNFHPEHSHVIPALLRRFHEAKISAASEVMIWGTGKPRREFLYVDDLAEACFVLMEKYNEQFPINIGTGLDLSISELVSKIKDVVGYEGEINFDPSMPDGMPRKVLEVSKIKALGWEPKVTLSNGLKSAYEWAVDHNIFI